MNIASKAVRASVRTPKKTSSQIGTNLAHGLALAADGWAVFPVYNVDADLACACGGKPKCKPGKHPRCEHGHLDATTDEATIREWWSTGKAADRAKRWQCSPDSNIGIAVPDGIVVVDIDPKNGGDQTYEALTEAHGDWPKTRTVTTGSGGLHLYYRIDAGQALPKTLDDHGGTGIDLKQLGGYVLAPPSNHRSGGQYSCTDWKAKIARAPAWLRALATPRSERSANREAVDLNPDRLTDAVRERCDRIVKIITPEFEPGSRHHIATALGCWLAANQWPAEAAAYVFENVECEDPEAKVEAALWGFTVEQPGGYTALSELVSPKALAKLDRVVNYQGEAMAKRREQREAKKKPAAPAEEETEDEDREGYDPTVDHVIEHLAAPACGVYQRGGKLATVTRVASEAGGVIRPEGSPTIRDLVPARLREIVRMTAGPKLECHVPDVIARGEWSHIRPLDAIVTFPVMRRDGSILTSSGYDAPTRTMAEMSLSVGVPDEPTQADARAAVATLSSLVSDFPFVGDGHRAAWLAALLTPLARPAIDGPTPMLLLDASARGSGKTLLADVISTIVTGADATRRTAPETAEEWRKVIFAMLLAGDPLVLIDNVTRMLTSAALDAVLTGTTYQDRVLGVSEERRVPIRTTLMASTNNARISTDLVRRTLLCRLEPDVEQPETRTGFRFPDLLRHVRRKRARYLECGLTILRAYAVAGRPSVDARPMGSYTAWCRVVRDALVWAGAADPAETQDTLREKPDVERDELRDLLVAWHAVLGERAVSVREVIGAAESGQAPGTKPIVGSGLGLGTRLLEASALGRPLADALRGIMPNGVEPAAHAVGNRLRSLRGQITGGLVLRAEPRTRDGSKWRVQLVGRP